MEWTLPTTSSVASELKVLESSDAYVAVLLITLFQYMIVVGF